MLFVLPILVRWLPALKKKATLRWLLKQVQAPIGNIPKVLVYAYTGKITGISNYINVEPALSIQSD